MLLSEAQKSHLSKNEPIPELGRDTARLESCLQSPFQTFLGFDLYRGFEGKAAILFYLLIKNHPLSNGNKRMACIALSYFAEKNKVDLNIPSSVMYKMAKDTASSIDKDVAIDNIRSILLKYLR